MSIFFPLPTYYQRVKKAKNMLWYIFVTGNEAAVNLTQLMYILYLHKYACIGHVQIEYISEPTGEDIAVVCRAVFYNNNFSLEVNNDFHEYTDYSVPYKRVTIEVNRDYIAELLVNYSDKYDIELVVETLPEIINKIYNDMPSYS